MSTAGVSELTASEKNERENIEESAINETAAVFPTQFFAKYIADFDKVKLRFKVVLEKFDEYKV